MTQVESLQLIKYGHFDDLTVEFGPGLTVVYGRNEAGKSTLLDGLTGFLWGIARSRNRRALLVQPGMMALVGQVSVDGEQVTYRRRLGDLLDAKSAKVPAPWGEPADKEMWQHGFGLDHARLLMGGQTIVAGDDDPAGIEFLAETGIDIDAVRAAIEARMDKLFKPHGGAKNVEVRRLTARIREIDSLITAQLSSAVEVVALRAELAQIEEQLVAAEGDEKRLRTHLARTTELLRCLGNAGGLRDARKLVEQTRAAGRCLTRDEVRRLDDALAQRDKGRKDQQSAEAELTTLQAKEQKLAPNEDLLVLGPTIDALVQQVESRRTDSTVKSGAQVAAADTAVRARLAALGSAGDDVEDDYRRVLLAKDRIEQLDRVAGEVETVQGALATQQKRVGEARTQLAEETASAAGEAETSVTDARARRDEAWLAVREPWLSGELPEARGRAQLAADVDAGIADADVVAETRSESLAAVAEARGTRRAREEALAAEERELATCKADEASAVKEWVTRVAETGLQAGTDPAAWRVRAGNLRALQEAWDGRQELAVAAKAAADRYAEFEAKVAEVAVVLTSVGEDPFANLERLRLDLEEAKKAASRLAGVEEQTAKAQAALTQAQGLGSQAADEIATVAGDDDPAELSERSHTLHTHQATVEQLLGTLRDQKDSGSDLDEMLAELAETDAVTLALQEESLSEDLQAASTKRLDLSTERGAQRKALDGVEGRGSVADLEAEREDLVGQLREVVDEYRNLYLQQAILDAYREGLADDSGTGILEVAGEYLSRLTEGRYAGFAIGNEGQKRVLRIVSRVDAGGGDQEMGTSELSTGTEYQVYFALRLAGIAAKQSDRVEAGQPTLPVVLDDVLLAYDDYRTKSALALLAELGQEFQVVVMTHSRSVLTDAEAMDGVATVELAGPVAVAG